MQQCKMQQFILPIILLSLIACDKLQELQNSSKAEYPKTKVEHRRDRLGKLTSDNSVANILSYFSNDDDSEKTYKATAVSRVTAKSSGNKIYFAALQAVSNMPLLSTDANSGVIITEWYEDPKVKGERYKLNILIMSDELKQSSVKISSFKQILVNKEWVATSPAKDSANRLEKLIIDTARNM